MPRSKHNRPPSRLLLALLTIALLGAPGIARAQLNSNIANVSLNAVLAEQLTVSVTSGSTVNFSLSPTGISTGDVPASISTTWTLGALRTSVSLYGYFDTPASALSDGSGHNISSAQVLGRMTTGVPVTYAPFTQTNTLGPATGSLHLFTQVVALSNLNSNRNDNLDLEISLASTPQLPAATYTGTLRLRAQAL